MHIALDYDAEVDAPFSPDFFATVALRTLTAFVPSSFPAEIEIHISVTCISREKIAELNADYRGINKVTDVLSFGEYEKREDFARETTSPIFLGEIFLCPDFIREASEEDKVTFEREMTYIFSHGVLHLIGFDHEEEMFTLQEQVTDVLTGKKEYTIEKGA
ncbi:MAG: rRNA maturation RNase YbeY [Candidatus Moranbacteria bacterium]|nr:rRNA maturation RNase YbeY [Candidatus Moranbacteria bacterium]OIQ02718.1 MAG: rRNA maturation RNase YbeY [Candidatus Moranbacteria bacterium CG2_30_41_165]PIP26057.1 MAG: rRNA maturation RNase YbeY [Candidatus Moranbacteria bacterium CG23_combo_of_CG06-09_8_20_14_all_41_28]PIV86420.1 MAG: rRNA maturation RNase YbeY [Candidatus Moranbacteria bacterium CG17_big_fil_post_rev_8_21_14_2_50_41_107]PIW94390.1 MAG: rRNA maturation RNase YbeY [Candidatus Moranbacteria bacterium CG_4_8_14_3_um_filter